MTLRRLVEQARKLDEKAAVRRQAVEACHKFLWDLAGDEPGFEEATRALFAGDWRRVRQLTSGWPKDIVSMVNHYLNDAAVDE